MIIEPVKDETTRLPSFLSLSDGRKLAYRLTPGALPGVVFFGGFKSDMTGSKATALEAFCKEHGRRFLRFDYTGHGQSSGLFTEGTIGAWKQDALDVIDHLVPKDNIVVGSSMGAWLMLLVALERQGRVKGLIGIASAPDFTEALIWQQFNTSQKQQMTKEGAVMIPDCYGAAPYPITRALIEEGRQHLLLNAPISLTMPVRLLHGTKDEDVPWQMSVTLADRLISEDVRLTLIKGGNHRLSEPEHLGLLCRTVEEVTSSCT